MYVYMSLCTVCSTVTITMILSKDLHQRSIQIFQSSFRIHIIKYTNAYRTVHVHICKDFFFDRRYCLKAMAVEFTDGFSVVLALYRTSMINHPRSPSSPHSQNDYGHHDQHYSDMHCISRRDPRNSRHHQ